MNYLGKYSPWTAGVCKPLRKLASPKKKWAWNNTYQNLYERAKTSIKKNLFMAFYNKKEQLC